MGGCKQSMFLLVVQCNLIGTPHAIRKAFVGTCFGAYNRLAVQGSNIFVVQNACTLQVVALRVSQLRVFTRYTRLSQDAMKSIAGNRRLYSST